MSSSKKNQTSEVPTWLLERLAQGELAASRVDELRKRLAAEGRSLDDEVAALATSNQKILSELDKPATLTEIRRRAVRGAPGTTRRSSFNFWIAPLAVAGSLGIGLFMLRPGHIAGPGTSTPEIRREPARGESTWESEANSGAKSTSESEATRAKGGSLSAGPRLLVYRQRMAAANDTQPERLGDGARAAGGDLLQLAYAAATDGSFGVLVSIDGAGRVTQHLPEPGAPAAVPLRSAREIRLPSAYELDDAPGFERFLLVTSAHAFPVAAALEAARTLATQGPEARSAPLALTPAFHQTSILLQKTNKGTP